MAGAAAVAAGEGGAAAFGAFFELPPAVDGAAGGLAGTFTGLSATGVAAIAGDCASPPESLAALAAARAALRASEAGIER